jgi:hypothetical protein
MAFLQRITNGEGRIEREYAAGRGRIDLTIEYREAWNIIEIKLVKEGQSFEAVKAQGIEQISRYHNTVKPAHGLLEPVRGCYLVIFDRRHKAKELPLSEKLSWNREGRVTVVGC